jgi:prevent-host-death family protein
LRNRSNEIMDAVQRGQSFTVTRDGHRVAELVPLRRRRRFVPRQEFAAMSRNAPSIDIETFRADQDAVKELPLYTTNPKDFVGLDKLLTVVSVQRPTPPHER